MSEGLTPHEEKQILQARLRALHKGDGEENKNSCGIFVVSRIASSVLAFDTEYAVAADKYDVTPIAHDFGMVQGLVHIRGKIHGFADLHKKIEQPEKRLAIRIDHDGQTLILAIDELIGAQHLYEEDFLDTSDSDDLGFIQNTTTDKIHIVDTKKLLQKFHTAQR